MFAVYNNGSVGFRSTADNLYELKNIEAPNKVLLKPDDDDLFQEYLNQKKQNQKQNAIEAYKKIANIEMSEIVYEVKDIMNKEPISIDNNQSVKEAYEKLKANQVNQLPIVSFGKTIVGLINKKIILNLIMDDLENIEHTLNKKLEDLYLPELITTDPITDIRRVSKVMIDLKLDAIPVVDENHILVGIVSKTDIIKAVSHLPKLQLWS